jgi:hypothetical protein
MTKLIQFVTLTDDNDKFKGFSFDYSVMISDEEIPKLP